MKEHIVSAATAARPARVTVRDVVKGDRVPVNGGWPLVEDVRFVSAGRRRLVLAGGLPFPAMSADAGILVRRAPAPAAPQLAEPTNPQPVTVAEFKRAMTPGTRWLVTNHYITREDHVSFGTTERTVERATGSHLYLPLVGEEGYGIPWPKRGQVQRADGGIFLTYGGGAGQGPDDLFLTIRPA